MSLDIAPAIRAALINESTISGLLTEWQNDPAIFTRRPVPEDAAPPYISISEDISITDEDYLNSKHPIVVRDIIAIGHDPDDYRAVEQLGYSIRDLFHRQRFSITLDGFTVLDIRANGPRAVTPGDDEFVARLVSVTFLLRANP